MRKRALAVAAVTIIAGTAFAKHKKPDPPIPPLVQAKVLGVHCAAGNDVVEPKVCQTIIDQLRATLKYAVRNCPDVADANGEIHVTCLPKNDADLRLDVSEDYSQDDAYHTEETDLLASLYCVSGHSFVCHPENPEATDLIINWTVRPGDFERIRDNTFERAHGLVGALVKLIDLRGGDNLQPYKAEIEKEYGIKH